MRKFDSINVIPFIDIMLVLLVIVLTAASFISQKKIKINIPQSQSQTPIERRDIIKLITLTKHGKFYYQDQIITISELDKLLSTWESSNPITVNIDAQTAFQDFIRLSDLLTKHEHNKVTIVTLPSPKHNITEIDSQTTLSGSP